MYVIEHAFLNLGKNKGRNILLGVIIFTIITAVTVTLAIFNTTGIVIGETTNVMNSTVRVVPSDGQKIISEEATAAISLQQYQSFAESENLDSAEIKESHTSVNGVDAVYFLKHPDMLKNFEAELRKKGLPDNYSVVTDESAFQNAIGSVANLQSLMLTFLIIVLSLGAVIMMLLSAITIRERKYEIGVLRAMGMKKNKVTLGLWVEILTITLICFTLGMGAGTMLSQPVSDMILAGQTASTSAGSTSLAERLNIMTETEEPIQVNVSVNAVTATGILGISILLASIAGVISVSQINKCEPIKILMERN
ncbi:MAG: ABC transporter permease [Lachnospiraceae bacterium]|nr:ABC transporter permease [Lachnospiraceae bacterium]